MDNDNPDPRSLTAAYIDKHHISELFEMIIAELLIQKPEEPRAFTVAYLEQLKTRGAQHFCSNDDLAAMFGLFDATRKGSITAGQADNALRTLLGARFQNRGNDSTVKLNEQAFVEYMSQQLKASTPYTAAAK